MKKYLPTRDHLRKQKSLRFLGEMMFANNLWHFNRHSVSFAFLVGLFCCFLPIPFQMLPGVALSMWVGANIPLTVALIWISNPLTIPPLFYATYRFGTWMMNRESQVATIQLNWDWLSSQVAVIWQPLLLGSLVTGLVASLIGFLLVRLYWRWLVARNWARRRQRQQSRTPKL